MVPLTSMVLSPQWLPLTSMVPLTQWFLSPQRYLPPNDDKNHLNSDNDFHFNSQTCEQKWTLGAGGAITALSDPVAEWEEMRVSLLASTSVWSR